MCAFKKLYEQTISGNIFPIRHLCLYKVCTEILNTINHNLDSPKSPEEWQGIIDIEYMQIFLQMLQLTKHHYEVAKDSAINDLGINDELLAFEMTLAKYTIGLVGFLCMGYRFSTDDDCIMYSTFAKFPWELTMTEMESVLQHEMFSIKPNCEEYKMTSSNKYPIVTMTKLRNYDDDNNIINGTLKSRLDGTGYQSNSTLCAMDISEINDPVYNATFDVLCDNKEISFSKNEVVQGHATMHTIDDSLIIKTFTFRELALTTFLSKTLIRQFVPMQKIYGISTTDELIRMAIKFGGSNIFDCIKQITESNMDIMDPNHLPSIVLSLALSLDNLHCLGFSHGDIKIENIMIKCRNKQLICSLIDHEQIKATPRIFDDLGHRLPILADVFLLTYDIILRSSAFLLEDGFHLDNGGYIHDMFANFCLHMHGNHRSYQIQLQRCSLRANEATAQCRFTCHCSMELSANDWINGGQKNWYHTDHYLPNVQNGIFIC